MAPAYVERLETTTRSFTEPTRGGGGGLDGVSTTAPAHTIFQASLFLFRYIATRTCTYICIWPLGKRALLMHQDPLAMYVQTYMCK